MKKIDSETAKVAAVVVVTVVAINVAHHFGAKLLRKVNDKITDVTDNK